MQSALKTLFRIHAASTTDLATLAARISAGLHEETGGVPYATAILARFDRPPARMTFVNAGHPPGFLMRDGGPSRSARRACRWDCGPSSARISSGSRGWPPGPPGVDGWEDDRTSLSFRVLHPRSRSGRDA